MFLVGRQLLGRFALRSLVVLKPLVALARLDPSVVEACTKEAVVLFLTSPEVVGDTMEEQVVNEMVVVAEGVQVIHRAQSFSIYRVLMLEMEMSPSLLSKVVQVLNPRYNLQVLVRNA